MKTSTALNKDWKHSAVGVVELPHCDFCKEDFINKPATVDGKTCFGPWANMCDVHFSTHGVGLGLGKGQRLIKE